MGPRRRVAMAPCLLFLACGKGSTAPIPVDASPHASVTPVQAPRVSQVPSASAAPSAAGPSPPLAGPCVLASGYRGTVAGRPVFARLDATAGKLHGRYFYASVGADIALDGTLSPAGVVTLKERTGGKVTGLLDGTCDGSGTIAGSWRAGSKSDARAFSFVPIPQDDVPVVAKKRWSVSRPAPQVGTSGMTTCSYKEERDEVFGLRSVEAERAINGQGLEVRTGPAIGPEEAKQVEGCDVAIEVGMSRGIDEKSLFRDFITVSQGGYAMMDGAAHPDNAEEFGMETYDLRTGKTVTRDAVFTRDPTPLVESCIAKQWKDPNFGSADIASYFRGRFVLIEAGVHFVGEGYPHVLGALTGQGPTIGYRILLRDGLLKAASPFKRAWEGVAPAAKEADACDGPAWL